MMINQSEQNNTIVCGPENAEKCIIWLHGLGASGSDLAEGVWPAFPLAMRQGWRAIFPNAPQQRVTINNGAVMPAWFDLYSISDRSKEDEVGLANSAQMLKEIITTQIELGIEPSKIVVAGFSQGGAIALYSLLQLDIKLGAVISLSAYVPMAGLNNLSSNPNNLSTAIMLMHGEYDDIVPYNALADAEARLKGLGYKPQSKSYAMAHEMCPSQAHDLMSFLQAAIK
jgi:phospholipase/carboxylesterase